MKTQPKLITIMGVSGCGKSTVAKALAEYYGYLFVEADDFHSETNKQWMFNGNPLTDEMRAPWITSIQTYLNKASADQKNCVMSFSGLRKGHREQLRELDFDISFIFLQGSFEVIHQRLSKRKNHFMNSELLKSQFKALQDPLEILSNSSNREADIIAVSTEQTLPEVIASAIRELDKQ